MFLERLFGATIENPTFTLNDQMALDILGGPPSESGLRVNPGVANTYSPWFRGINLVSRDTAKLPLYVYQRTEPKEEGSAAGKEKFKEHPSYQVLRWKANQFQTAFHLKLQLTSHAMSYGNGMGYIVRDGDGSVLPVDQGGGIWPLDPTSTTPVRETITDLTSGALVSNRTWYATTINGQVKKLDSDDVLHIRGMGFDGLTGYDVVKLATSDIGRGLAQRKFANTFFKNGAHLKVVLETPNVLQPHQAREILDGWNNAQGGLDNAHRTAILHRGLKANHIAATARESQFIEGEEFVIRFVANFLGIPPHKLGAKTGESYASKEQENLDYLFQALDFWLCAWEDECRDKLLTEREKLDDSVHVEFSREKFYEADLKTKAEYGRISLGGAPWAKVNEVRGMFNMNPVEGGDEIKSPLNMSGAQSKEPPNEPPEKIEDVPEDESEEIEETDDAKEAAVRAGVRDTVRRMVRRVGNAAERAAKSPAEFMTWIENLEKDHGDIIRASLEWAQPMSPKPMAAWLETRLKADLLEFAGSVTAKNLAAQVTIEMARLETAIPEAAVVAFFGE